MSIFIIGHTNTGKSTLAKRLANTLGFTHIPASEWIRSKYPDSSTKSLTEFSILDLKRNQAVCREFIYDKYKEDLESGKAIIEGIRNPEDFVHLFNPKEDLVCFLQGKPATTMEGKGVSAIEHIVAWRLSVGLLNYDQYQSFSVGSSSLEVWDLAYKKIIDKVPTNKKPEAGIHATIKPIPVFVNEDYLKDKANNPGNLYTNAEIIGLSSYKGHQLTLTLLINNKSIFEYLPLKSVRSIANRSEKILDDSCLVQKNCASGNIEVVYYPVNDVSCFFPGPNKWVNGKYLLTIDWVDDNELLNLVHLETGQLALVPHHKLQVGHNNFSLPEFKKLHTEWKLDI